MLPSASGSAPRPCALPGRLASSCTSGASVASALSRLAATGSSSYSTVMRVTAKSAAAWDSAATTATGSPVNRTFPMATIGRSRSAWP